MVHAALLKRNDSFDDMTKTVPGRNQSQDRLQPLPLQQVQQLERRPARVLFADLPLAHRGWTGVEHRSQHGLAQFEVLAQRTDFFAVVGRDGLQAERVQLLLLALVDEDQAVQIGSGFAHSFAETGPGFRSGGHLAKYGTWCHA